MMVEGTKNGDSLRRASWQAFFHGFASIKPKPPIPEPTATPIRGAFASLTSNARVFYRLHTCSNTILNK